jgi:hypothetical protein
MKPTLPIVVMESQRESGRSRFDIKAFKRKVATV